MIINKENINILLELYNMNPSKDKGQNYLVNFEISQKIVNLLEITKNDKIIEVGPGLGSLSHYILKQNPSATLLDIDNKTVNALNAIYDNSCNVVLDNGLKIDYSKYNKIISNLPYNITSDLIEHILLNSINAQKYVFMCQSENFSRITATKGVDYGPLMILISLKGKIKKEFNVSKDCFYPVPKCTSTVFSITSSQTLDNGELKDIYKFVKKAFGNRRKTILNNLNGSYGNKDRISKGLLALGLQSTVRAEEIQPNTYVDLYRILK